MFSAPLEYLFPFVFISVFCLNGDSVTLSSTALEWRTLALGAVKTSVDSSFMTIATKAPWRDSARELVNQQSPQKAPESMAELSEAFEEQKQLDARF